MGSKYGPGGEDDFMDEFSVEKNSHIVKCPQCHCAIYLEEGNICTQCGYVLPVSPSTDLNPLMKDTAMHPSQDLSLAFLDRWIEKMGCKSCSEQLDPKNLECRDCIERKKIKFK